MKLTLFGAGYVGLVSAACLAELGNHVLCHDRDLARIERLSAGDSPIFEPGLDELLERNLAGERLHFSADVAAAVAFAPLQMIAVGTPSGTGGAADLSQVMAAAQAIAQHMHEDKLVVIKSTVPVGSGERVQAAIERILAARGVPWKASLASNPEFLREGSAVGDFMHPERVVIGAEDPAAERALRSLHARLLRHPGRCLVMDRRSAEMSKYAANAMLAARISLINELALLADSLGADIEAVRRAVGSDSRIGHAFLQPGCGYGGSCFPKDVKALLASAQEVGEPMHMLAAVERVNERQKHVLVERVTGQFGADLRGRRLALWGLAFKPGTDDMREAPSRVIVQELLRLGAEVRAHDPAALAQAAAIFGDAKGLHLVDSAMQALSGADALLIVTEWDAYRHPDLRTMRALMRRPLVFDGRNLLDPQAATAAGFEYHAIGREAAARSAASPRRTLALAA